MVAVCVPADELKGAFTRRTVLGTVFGFVSIVGITPLLAFACRELPYNPAQFTAGKQAPGAALLWPPPAVPLEAAGMSATWLQSCRELPHANSRVLSAGIVIFCIVPTTLGVGVSLVTSAKVRQHACCGFACVGRHQADSSPGLMVCSCTASYPQPHSTTAHRAASACRAAGQCGARHLPDGGHQRGGRRVHPTVAEGYLVSRRAGC